MPTMDTLDMTGEARPGHVPGIRETKRMTRGISLAGVAKTFRRDDADDEVVAIAEVSGDIDAGDFLVIVGPSGCGKSTLLEMIGGLQTPSRGSVLFDGQKVDRPHPAMSTIFQEDSLFPWRTAIQNMEFGLEMRGVGAAERRECCLRLLTMLGLSRFAHRYPRELSGGMRQRVAIGRSLALKPQVLLMDEPFGALDQQTRYHLAAELCNIWERTRTTIVFVTHDINEAVLLGNRVWVLSHRPAVIKLEVRIDIPRPRDLGVLTTAKFHEATNALWLAVSEESKKALAADS